MEICVADIAKQGYVYDRDADVAECAAATWYPGGGGDPLHVEDIRVILDASRDRALGRFWVEDHMGNPVEGVLVTAEWTVNGVGQGAETKGTNSAGIAVFHLVSPPPGAELDICVESLAKNGYGYNEHANVVHCESDAWWVGIGDALYVADVRLVLKQPQDRALGWIYVEDQTGTRIKGVTVTAEWRVDGNGEGEVAKRTNSNGRATFRYDSPSPGAMLEICVHDLTKTGYVYFAAANVADCDTATWPGGADEPG
jgi:hypothetical protein